MKIIESTLRSAVQNGLIGSFYVESEGFTFRVVEGMKSEFPLVFVIDVVLVFFTRFDFDLISLSAGCGTVGHLQVPPLVQYQRLNWLQTTVTFLAKRAVNASIWISVAMASTTALMDPMRKDAVSSFWFFVYFVIFSFFFFFFFFLSRSTHVYNNGGRWNGFLFLWRGGGGSLHHFPPFFLVLPFGNIFPSFLFSPPFLSVCVGYFVLCLALIVIISSFITPSLNKVNGTCP